jgi:hypothetical protein
MAHPAGDHGEDGSGPGDAEKWALANIYTVARYLPGGLRRTESRSAAQFAQGLLNFSMVTDQIIMLA